MRMTEEEWTEQVLNFEHYKRRGPMYLDKAFTQVRRDFIIILPVIVASVETENEDSCQIFF